MPHKKSCDKENLTVDLVYQHAKIVRSVSLGLKELRFSVLIILAGGIKLKAQRVK